MIRKPFVCIVLDGFGVAPPGPGNAVSQAEMPCWKRLRREGIFTTLKAHGTAVGLPPDQAGNSEAGHLNIGAGRVVEQDAVRIAHAINEGTFFHNPAFLSAIKHVRENKSALHIMGLFTGTQSGHAHSDHWEAIIALLRVLKVPRVYFHLFTDGRDMLPYAARDLFKKYEKAFLSVGKISTLMGRFYAMDRNKEWWRIEKAYNVLTRGEGKLFSRPLSAINDAYKHGDSDEFIPPSVVVKNGKPIGSIKNNDSLIFLNLRSERAREITKPFVQDQFEKRGGGFTRKKVLKNIFFVALTDFGPDLDSVVTAFPAVPLQGTLPFALGIQSCQYYIAESEKYAHVTYFVNGGHADPISHETRIKVVSPSVRSFKEAPEMNISGIVREIQKILNRESPCFLFVNIANPDMIGHTGDITSAIRALRIVDQSLEKICKMVRSLDGILLITGDHGNIEEMINVLDGTFSTHHTKNPVPFLLWMRSKQKFSLRRDGVLSDVAPTILELLHIEQPKEMTGKSLLKHRKYAFKRNKKTS